jgi:hypothetical protein
MIPMAKKKAVPVKADPVSDEEKAAADDKARAEEISSHFKDEAKAAVIERDPGDTE